MFQSEIGSRIKEMRNELHLTQQKFAERIGITQAHLSAIENGRDKPSESLIRIIHMEFNCSMYWLRTGEGSMFHGSFDIEKIVQAMPKAVLKRYEGNLINALTLILNDTNENVQDIFLNIIYHFEHLINKDESQEFLPLILSNLAVIIIGLIECYSESEEIIKKLLDRPEKENKYAALGKISKLIMDHKNQLSLDLDDYQQNIYDRFFGKI